MSLLNQIKADSLEARKAGAKNSAALLTTLYSEAAAVGKNNGNRESTDEEVIKVVRRFVKNNDETLGHLREVQAGLADNEIAKVSAELTILRSYLPAELTDENIQEAIAYVVQPNGPETYMAPNLKMMPHVKAYIDNKWPRAYDGKRVSEIVKKQVNG